ncbi:MAG: hypothetical protein Q9227_005893 [Pyrenula ochraceoflavens]
MGRDLINDRAEAYKNGKGQQIYAQHFEAYGKTFQENCYGRTVITTMEPANFQYVGALAFDDFVKGNGGRTGASAELVGPGILTSSGSEWKRSRDLIKPIFSRGEIADVNIIDKHVRNFLSFLPQDNSTVDVLPLIQKMFLDASSEFLLGKSLNALSTDPPAETTAFLNTFDKALRNFGRWRAAPWIYYNMWRFDTGYRKACKQLHAFLDGHVQRALREVATTASGNAVDRNQDASFKGQADSSHRYILLNELAKNIRDASVLRAELMNIFLVARDNVASLVGNALFYLARNPEVWTSLRRVSQEEVGSQPLTFELLKSLTLFKYVFQETLRVQGPTPYAVRTAVRSTILPTGGGRDGTSPVFVEKGTRIHLNIWSLNHDKSIWGSDAYVFRPDRWADKNYRVKGLLDIIMI